MSRITIIITNFISTASVYFEKTKQGAQPCAKLYSVLVGASKGAGKLGISLEMEE